jgi:hypothetical protein
LEVVMNFWQWAVAAGSALTPHAKAWVWAALVTAGFVGMPVGYMYYEARSDGYWEYLGGDSTQVDQSWSYRGAPGPLAGAGLPAFLVIGGVVYWFGRKRRRDKAGTPPQV